MVGGDQLLLHCDIRTVWPSKFLVQEAVLAGSVVGICSLRICLGECMFSVLSSMAKG